MGLNLKDFLTSDAEQPKGNRKFLKNWKKDGEIVVFLSTQADFCYPFWSHQFYTNEVFVDDRTGEEKEFLKLRKFVSPESDVVLKQQYFREQNNGDVLQTPVLLDPFIKLREWLRLECEDMPLDQVVFQWHDPKHNKDIIWRRGELAKLVDKTKDTFSHTLDAKKEYFFVVADANELSSGLQIARVTKSLGDAIRVEVEKIIDSEGEEEGNPQVTPYALKWKFDNTAPPAKMYSAAQYKRVKPTDDVLEVINNPSFPDPEPECAPKDNDMEEIRAAMVDAATIDLPLDMLFSSVENEDQAAE